MRRFLLCCGWIVVGVLLAACQTSPPVIPTLAQLPTVTPEVFVTNTPEGEAMPPAESGEGGGDIEAPDTSGDTGGDVPPGFASPTPETLPVEGMGGGGGECSNAEINALMAAMDRTAVQAELDDFVARLTGAAATVGDWTYNPNPAETFQATLSGDLPEALLVYERADGQTVPLVVARLSPDVRDYMSACMDNEETFREEDMPAEVTITVTPLAFGDQAVQVTLTQAASPEMVEAGLDEELRLDVIMVRLGQNTIQHIGTPPLPGMASGPPVTTEDVIALIEGVVTIAQGL